MKTIKQIAEAYSLSPNSVKTWSTAKRERASKLIETGINPVEMQLLGELYALCYAASVDGYSYQLTHGSLFLNVCTFKDNIIGAYAADFSEFSAKSIRQAIEIMEGIVYA